MLTITNFDPIKSINSFIKPLGLAVLTKQQIIAKTTMVVLAIIALSEVMEFVQADRCEDSDRDLCTGHFF